MRSIPRRSTLARIVIAVLIIAGVAVLVIAGSGTSSEPITGGIRAGLNQNGYTGTYTDLTCPSVTPKPGTRFSCTFVATRTAAHIERGDRYRMGCVVVGVTGRTVRFDWETLSRLSS